MDDAGIWRAVCVKTDLKNFERRIHRSDEILASEELSERRIIYK